jgi:hypothetical protein
MGSFEGSLLSVWIDKETRHYFSRAFISDVFYFPELSKAVKVPAVFALCSVLGNTVQWSPHGTKRRILHIRAGINLCKHR